MPPSSARLSPREVLIAEVEEPADERGLLCSSLSGGTKDENVRGGPHEGEWGPALQGQEVTSQLPMRRLKGELYDDSRHVDWTTEGSNQCLTYFTIHLSSISTTILPPALSASIHSCASLILSRPTKTFPIKDLILSVPSWSIISSNGVSTKAFALL